MNKTKAQELAISLMAKHGVGHLPFSFDRGKRCLGTTTFRKSTKEATGISLSAYWVEACDETEVRDTILHEIAHAQAGFSAGHGPLWKHHARSIGCNAMRCAEPSEEAKARLEQLAPAPWVGTCPSGHESKMYRAPGRVKSCTKCCPRFNKDYIIHWKQNGRTVPMPAKYAMELQRITNGVSAPPRRSKPKTMEDYFRF